MAKKLFGQKNILTKKKLWGKLLKLFAKQKIGYKKNSQKKNCQKKDLVQRLSKKLCFDTLTGGGDLC